MKRITALLLLLVFFIPTISTACTTFLLEKNGQLAFGKNYDWETAVGLVHTNLRSMVKTSLPIDGTKSFQWTAKYGSVTFNQYGKEFPNGGLNEKGLVVELMWLNESEYPKPDSRPALSVLQWIQYQLDNCSTIEEVLATEKRIRIVSSGTPQHYLVADASGHAATIEFLNGKLVAHWGNDLPYKVLANDPYAVSLKNNNNNSGRFSTACKMVQQFEKTATKKPVVDYAFDILNKVAQGNYTKWSIVYDITNKEISFKTLNYPGVKKLDMKRLNFEAGSTPLLVNINMYTVGDVNKHLVPFSAAVNSRMLKQAFKESSAKIEVPNELQEAMAAIGAGVKR
jgi:penicillin V acylase-like amidase (Ntn superfamily)